MSTQSEDDIVKGIDMLNKSIQINRVNKRQIDQQLNHTLYRGRPWRYEIDLSKVINRDVVMMDNPWERCWPTEIVANEDTPELLQAIESFQKALSDALDAEFMRLSRELSDLVGKITSMAG